MAIPPMLLNLGLQLRRLRVRDVGSSLAAVAIRIGGGFACALLYVAIAGVKGTDRQVLLLMSAMPAAVIDVVIAERYRADEGLVASAIVIGTLLSVLVIPAVLLFLA